MEGATTGLGNPTNTLTVVSNAAFSMLVVTNQLDKKIVLHDIALLRTDGGNNTIVGPVSMFGDFGAGPTFDITGTLNLAGVVSGAGNLAKTGPGTLSLSATNNYTGTTTVHAGQLVLTSAKTGSGEIAVNDGAALGVVFSGSTQLHPAALTYGSAGLTTNEFIGVAGIATAPIIAGILVVNSTTTVNIESGALISGLTYPLISFGSISRAGGFVLGTLPAGVTATIITNGGNTFALSVSTAPVSISPTQLNCGVSGGKLILSWRADHIGWRLLEQTNNLAFGVSANPNDWGTVADSAFTNHVSIPQMSHGVEVFVR
jgi:autotransporter-associated beta strand protein